MENGSTDGTAHGRGRDRRADPRGARPLAAAAGLRRGPSDRPARGQRRDRRDLRRRLLQPRLPQAGAQGARRPRRRRPGPVVVVGSKRMPGASDERARCAGSRPRCSARSCGAGSGCAVSDTHGMKVLNLTALAPTVAECQFGTDLFDTELIIRAERSRVRDRGDPRGRARAAARRGLRCCGASRAPSLVWPASGSCWDGPRSEQPRPRARRLARGSRSMRVGSSTGVRTRRPKAPSSSATWCSGRVSSTCR